jgi:dimethylamine/trimethylamine dehydrogenase
MPLTPDPRHQILLEPVRIGPKTLRNRFYQVPHSTGFGSHAAAGQARFRSTRAEGGWAAVCVELCSIMPESDRSPLPAPARLWDDGDVRDLARMCDEVHGFGSLAGVELWHSGSSTDLSPSRTVPGGPSQLPSDAFPLTYPRELDRAEIREIQRCWVAAAARARSAGFDIVYVYGAHGYLPQQFLSPFYNHRTDEYGGSLRNRARFWLETLELVRAEVGEQCAVAVRIGLDDGIGKAVPVEDALEFVALADPLVDLWDVNTSSIAEPWLDMRPSRLAPAAFQTHITGRVREATAKPIVGVGRLTDPDQMADLIRTGRWDLIGAARPAIADPFLPTKVAEGRAEEIRACIGCNICLSRIRTGQTVACTQNPTAGEEFRRGWHPERVPIASNTDRRVVVIGAGAAGLECAVTLAQRGMSQVELVDAGPDIGGYAALSARLPGLGEWSWLIDDRRRRLERLPNVTVTLNTKLDASAAHEWGADIIVLATGARWRSDGLSQLTHQPLPITAEAHVMTPEEVITNPARVGSEVVVYDCEGYYVGAGLAQLVAGRGGRVSLVTPHLVVGPFLDLTFEGGGTRAALTAAGVEVLTEATLSGIAGSESSVRRHGQDRTLHADTFVLATARRSVDDLTRELSAPEEDPGAARPAVYAIGDCVAPRPIAECIFDGHRLAREIESEDPRRPLPFRRERWQPQSETSGEPATVSA